MLLVACGDEESEALAASADAEDARVSDVGGSGGGGSDVGGSDVVDAEQGDVAADVSTRDTPVDVVEDSTEDAGPACVDPSPRCQECSLDFTGADIDRPSTRVAQIANDAGVLRIRNVYLVNTPPLLQLSNSWISYIVDRAAPDWVPNESLTGFDSVGSLIPINAGEIFELEVAFNEVMDGPTGCSAGSCGTAVVEYELCDGSVGSETITIARR
ncbi:MAG: hypothetical protein ACJAYU_001044 [Bradymonadia bacterium]